ncbi:hypothetical protein J3P95_24370 [Pseudomonas sp. Z5-35]|uniref:hypothetical protein n=1 Tax=unclassified Pseudomonas TaxID=196821 RepID=UPI003DAA339D
MTISHRIAMRGALLYLLLSVAWLQLVGYLLSSLFDHSADRLRWQLINGYAWVLVSAGQLLRNADSALFKAKSSGRDGYALYTEELTAHAQQRRSPPNCTVHWSS